MAEKHRKSLDVTTETFDSLVLHSDVPVLLDFWAVWCGPCKMLEPTIEGLASEYGDRLKVGRVDVDSNPELARRYAIRAVPTVVLFARGELKGKLVGLLSRSDYRAQIDAWLH